MIIPNPMASMKSVITIKNVGDTLYLGLAVIFGSELSVISCSTSSGSHITILVP